MSAASLAICCCFCRRSCSFWCASFWIAAACFACSARSRCRWSHLGQAPARRPASDRSCRLLQTLQLPLGLLLRGVDVLRSSVHQVGEGKDLLASCTRS